jgi:hypothetical protein
MKIQVDIVNKTIKVEGDINLQVLFKHIKQFLPDGQWKEYELETNTVINWNTGPVYPTYPIYPSYPTYDPTYEPSITCEGIDFSASNTLTNVINTTSGTIVNFEVT